MIEMREFMTDEQYAARLAEIAERIPADVRADLTRAHDYHLGCNAHSEGQECCLYDTLLRADPPADDQPEDLCGAVYADPLGVRPPQDPCGKRRGHAHGPETDWKRDYHSNGSLKWPVRDTPRSC